MPHEERLLGGTDSTKKKVPYVKIKIVYRA